MLRKNFPHRRKQRNQEAVARQELYNKLSLEERLFQTLARSTGGHDNREAIRIKTKIAAGVKQPKEHKPENNKKQKKGRKDRSSNK